MAEEQKRDDAGGSLPTTEPALRAIAMPADTNPRGDIFGGWLLSQMDLAGSTAAIRRARGRVATVAVTSMTFRRPVFVGDEVSCYAEAMKVGRTSITVKIESWVRRGIGENPIKVTEGIFTYVAITDDGKPRAVPPEEAPAPK
ncbi:MAG: acyl-CoA thioesterase [Dongiaceae bacterium]